VVVRAPGYVECTGGLVAPSGAAARGVAWRSLGGSLLPARSICDLWWSFNRKYRSKFEVASVVTKPLRRHRNPRSRQRLPFNGRDRRLVVIFLSLAIGAGSRICLRLTTLETVTRGWGNSGRFPRCGLRPKGVSEPFSLALAVASRPDRRLSGRPARAVNRSRGGIRETRDLTRSSASRKRLLVIAVTFAAV
jgi:hypothetical protein